jgi:hypothetical protein
VVIDDAASQRRSDFGVTGHVALALVALLIFAALHLTTGRLTVGNGEGWDGTDYARMLSDGWFAGTVHTRLRPLIVWINTPLYWWVGNAVTTFDAMNFVYTGLLAFVLSMLLRRYGATTATRAVVIVCLVLTNHFRLFTFYPVLVDLGACVVMTAALLLILDGPRWAASVACVGAVLAREYAPVVMLFGAHRDLRRGVAWTTMAATYAPAAIVWWLLRIVNLRLADPGAPTFAELLENRVQLWDPFFVALLLHAVVTVGGGLSIVAAARPERCWNLIRQEPEWITYTAPVLVLTMLGRTDLWRYLTPLLPVVAVLFAWCVRVCSTRERLVLALAAIVLTVVTQEPLTRMNDASYFADWFPYYIRLGEYPFPSPPPQIWQAWGWRFLAVTVALCALLALRKDERVVAP